MIEIMTAESVARETIKNTLAIEIPKVNKAIEDAKKLSQRSCYIKERLSNGTIGILKKAGYDVDLDCNCTEISWENVYMKLMNNEKFIEEISQELNLKIVDIDDNKNIIDPNWTPEEDN